MGGWVSGWVGFSYLLVLAEAEVAGVIQRVANHRIRANSVSNSRPDLLLAVNNVNRQAEFLPQSTITLVRTLVLDARERDEVSHADALLPQVADAFSSGLLRVSDDSIHQPTPSHRHGLVELAGGGTVGGWVGEYRGEEGGSNELLCAIGVCGWVGGE